VRALFGQRCSSRLLVQRGVDQVAQPAQVIGGVELHGQAVQESQRIGAALVVRRS
jgi:hypothetical protein